MKELFALSVSARLGGMGIINPPISSQTEFHTSSLIYVEHAVSCPKGGFPSIRHNEIRDYVACLLPEICHNVSVGPYL